MLVLCYHAVSEDWAAALSVTPAALDRQLARLVGWGYRGATFEQAVRDPPHRRTLVVTFDDAFRSVRRLAAPILRRHGMAGSVYAVTDHVGTERPMAWAGIDHWLGGPHEHELLPMSWAELRELAEEGWEVGAHTRTHPRLTGCSDAELDDELRRGRELVEEAMGRPCRTLAYPYGDHDARVVAAAGAAGYAAACTLPAQLHRAQPLRWPRVGVYHVDTDLRFFLKAARPLRLARQTRLVPALRRTLLQTRRLAGRRAA